MLVLSKDLIQIAPYSRTTYFTKLREFKEKKKFKKKLTGNYLTIEEAEQIAIHLGFENEFKKYLIRVNT